MTSNEEHVKTISGYPNYLIYDDGRVWSQRKHGFLKPSISVYRNPTTGHEYKQARVQLFKDGKGKHMMIHRLVAEAFIPNPEHKPVVNHINEFNTLDNRKENLQWATLSENRQYGTNIQRSAQARRGRHLSEEAKQAIRTARTGTHLSEETRKKIGDAQIGVPHTETTKAKIRITNCSLNGRAVDGINIANPEIVHHFQSINDASRFITNDTKARSSIRRCLNGQRKSAYGYYWRYATVDYKDALKVLVACEESQRVATALRDVGAEAYSADLIECSGGHPEYHIMGDALLLLNGNTTFQTEDGNWHSIAGKWDMIIAFPPCQFLSNAGACRLYPRKGEMDVARYKKGLEAKEFFLKFLNNPNCDHIAVENPVSSKVFNMPPHSQEIQPYLFDAFGEHPYTKKTRLWLKGLPPLVPTTPNEIPVGPYVPAGTGRKDKAKYGAAKRGEDAKNRAKTMHGIAAAMAEQWSKYLEEK